MANKTTIGKPSEELWVNSILKRLRASLLYYVLGPFG